MVPNSQSVMCSIPHLAWLPQVLSYLSSLLFSRFSVVLVYSYQVWRQFIRPHTSHVRDSSIVQAISEKLYKIIILVFPLSHTVWLPFVSSLLSFLQFFHLIIVLIHPYQVSGQFLRLYTFHAYNSPIVQGVNEKQYKIIEKSCFLGSSSTFLATDRLNFDLFSIFSILNCSHSSISGVWIVYVAIHLPCS